MKPAQVTSANPGRIAAARALLEVEEGGHAEEVLPPLLPAGVEDRSLAWTLVFGVLRRRGRIDAALRACLSRPLDELDPPIRAVLRSATWEKLFGRAQAYAVGDQAVETLRALGSGRASGLVNAVIRRVGPVEGLARAESLDHPAWLVARWDHRFGAARTEAWCRANGEPPPLCLAARGPVSELSTALDAAGIVHRPAVVRGAPVPGLLRLEGPSGRVEALPGFAEGAFWVQDAASAWMTDLVPASARTVLDACAAPGGKTFWLAARGQEVVATDVDPSRLGRVAEGLSRLHLQARTRVVDWTRPPMDLGTFDAVLVDAPCTALGTVRRHPEIRWRRGPLDPARASERQLTILDAAARFVAPSGALIYVVCSPEPEEGGEVLRRFLEAHAQFSLEEVRTTAPPEDGEDAFFGARMVRR